MKVSNLPPGVTENMIPGNRPADVAYENLCEAVGDLVGSEFAEGDKFEPLCQWISDRLDDANRAGYQEGVQETKSQCSHAATILELYETWQRIEKMSHEL